MSLKMYIQSALNLLENVHEPFRFLAILLLLAALPLISAEIPWPAASPPEAGIHLPAMEAFKNELAARGTKNLLVIRHGKIAYEWYAPDSGPAKTHYTASMAKALVGGMSLLVALNDGRMAVGDPAHKYIPAWRSDPLKSKITIRHLATHSSGIEDAEEDGKPHNELTGWKGAFWKRDPNPFLVSLTQAPVLFEPGSSFHYSNTGMAALAYAVTASLRGAPHSDIRTLLRERLMAPLGIPDDQWNIGYGRAYELDGLKLYANWGGGNFTARATARVGQLMLQRGVWEGRPLFRANWVERMVEPAGTPPAARTMSTVSCTRPPRVITSSAMRRRSPGRMTNPRRSTSRPSSFSAKRWRSPRCRASSWPTISPPSAGEITASNSMFRRRSPRAAQAAAAVGVSASSSAHWKYWRLCRPERSTK